MQGQLIYEYGKNPVNYGKLEEYSLQYTEKNDVCGEYIRVDILLDKEKKIQEIAFEGDGRMVGIAAMSMLSEDMEEKSFSEIEKYEKEDILELLEVEELTTKRMRSAMLGLLALKNAYRTFTNQERLELEDITGE